MEHVAKSVQSSVTAGAILSFRSATKVQAEVCNFTLQVVLNDYICRELIGSLITAKQFPLPCLGPRLRDSEPQQNVVCDISLVLKRSVTAE